MGSLPWPIDPQPLYSILLSLCVLCSLDIKKQDLEIEAAQWMPCDIYAAQPVAQDHQLYKYIAELCLAKEQGDYTGLSPVSITSIFHNDLSHLYLNSRHLNQSPVSSDQS
ncbi:hypothetical protein ACB092_06G022400 [Castanea dentata]